MRFISCLAILALACISGCGGGGGTAATVTLSRAALVGTWKFTKVSEGAPNSGAAACPGGVLQSGFTNAYNIYCGSDDTNTLSADGTYVTTLTGLDGTTVYHPSGTWTLSGTTLTLNWPANTEVDTFTVSLSADGKTLTRMDDGYTETLVKQ